MGISINELDDVDVSTGSREVPDDGDYNVVISEANYTQTRDKTGSGYKIKYTILDGDFQGQEINGWINITNKSAEAQRIGRSELKTIMTVTGTENSDDLTGKMLRIRVVGEVSDYTDKQGRPAKSVNLRPKLFMTFEGKNAKGELAPAFVPSHPTAKEQVAQWRASVASQSIGGGAIDRGNTTVQHTHQSNQNNDFEDEIPF